MKQNNAKIKYIEFVGQPAVGKTTTAMAVANDEVLAGIYLLHPEGIFKQSKYFLYKNIFKIFIASLYSVFYHINFFLKHAKFSRYNYGRLVLFLRFSVRHQIHILYKPDLIIREDTLHLIPTIDYRKNVNIEKITKKYIRNFSNDYHGIVYFESDYEILEKRYIKREKNKNLSGDIIEYNLIKYKQYFSKQESVKKAINEQDNIPVIIIDGAKEIEQKKEEIINFIKEQVL